VGRSLRDGLYLLRKANKSKASNQGAVIDRASQTDKNRSKAARALRAENSIFATLRPLRGSASLVIVLALGPLQETDCARLEDQKAVIRVRRSAERAEPAENAAEPTAGPTI